MKIEFKKSFLKELKKLKNRSLRESIYESIIQVESVNDISQIKNLKKLTGYDFHYRIRVGDYRIGVKIEKAVVNFVVFENRKDIYKRFP